MRRILPLVALLSSALLHAQDSRSSVSHPDPEPDFNVPYSTVTFANPKLDSPIALPSTIMDGPPVCSSDYLAFYQFWTVPPTYDTKEIYSISSDGEFRRFGIEQLSRMKNPRVLSFDPGNSVALMLLAGSLADPIAASSSRGPIDYYLARFKYDGKLDGYAKLELGFQPGQVAQLDDNRILVIGTDPLNVRPIVALIDSTGRILRHMDAEEIVPSKAALTKMMSAVNFVGIDPKSMPPEMRLSYIMSIFRFVHDGNRLLLLEPGGNAQVVEFSPGGATRVVPLNLPKGEIAESVFSGHGRWIVRAHPEDTEGKSILFEVDRDTGATLREIRTSGVPATSIACSTDQGFYGLRWIDHKSYVVVGKF